MDELIKAALLKAGMPEDLHKQIKVEKEDEIEAAVEALKKIYEEIEKGYKPEVDKPLADFLKGIGYPDEDVSKFVQSETDKRVTSALETQLENLKKEGKLIEPKKDEKKVDDAVLSEIKQSIADLKGLVSGQQELDKKNKIREKALAALKAKKIPESWIDRVNVENESDVEAKVLVLETEYTEIMQKGVDYIIEETGMPKRSIKSGDFKKSMIDTYADSKKDEKENINIQKID